MAYAQCRVAIGRTWGPYLKAISWHYTYTGEEGELKQQWMSMLLSELVSADREILMTCDYMVPNLKFGQRFKCQIQIWRKLV